MTQRTCSIDGCDRERYGHGWCHRHYQRWRKWGDPLKTVRRLASSPEESFAVRAIRKGGCLVWTGAVHTNGYGIIWTGKRIMRAHRWAYERANGPIPAGQEIDHICGNRLCCEPSHLRLASRKQNMEHRVTLNSNNASGVRGVSRDGKRWRVRVKHNYQEYYGGVFDTVAEAEQVAIALRNELFTHNTLDHARLKHVIAERMGDSGKNVRAADGAIQEPSRLSRAA